MEFTAQADAHGDFILPLNRIPPLAADAPSSTYSAALTVKIASQNDESSTDVSQIDPDQLIEADIESFNNADDFLPFIEFDVTPGESKRIKKEDKSFIRLKYR